MSDSSVAFCPRMNSIDSMLERIERLWARVPLCEQSFLAAVADLAEDRRLR